MYLSLRAFNFRRVIKSKWWTLATLLLPMAAHADGTLNLICSYQAEWCTNVKNEFEKQNGVTVNMTQKSTGEALAQIAAEKANPKVDIWFGGTGDPHLQAAEQDLTVSYKSPVLPQLHDWARRQAEQSNYRTVGVAAGALGFVYNTELLAKKKLPAPACWKDLLKPEYKEEVQISNPNSAGTAYVVIATLVQLMGEDAAFKYMQSLHKNVNQYTKSGSGAVKGAARGETSVSVGWMHDGVTELVSGFPVKVSAPCEGTGYEISSMSLIKGARNLNNAKKFYDWALTPAAQKLGADAKQFQVPSNVSSALPPQAPKFSDIKFIDYNFAKYGSSAERKRLIERWDREVGSLSK
ncbi:MAG: ABC transporter substrate-binding protein [Gammaproteobacteria bacterium]|nr:ABC transporter substrate-binding protein [Gammaproteobacteria bacterium]